MYLKSRQFNYLHILCKNKIHLNACSSYAASERYEFIFVGISKHTSVTYFFLQNYTSGHANESPLESMYKLLIFVSCFRNIKNPYKTCFINNCFHFVHLNVIKICNSLALPT